MAKALFKDIVVDKAPTTAFSDIKVDAPKPIVSTPDAPEVKTEPVAPLASLASGFGKAFTLAPELFGQIGKAGEAAFNTATREGDQDFLANFEEAGKEGIDADLIKFSEGLTKKMTDTLGVQQHPVGTVNQLFELAGLLTVPVPSKFLRAKNIGLDLLGKAATFLAPTVRLGPKGNLLNIGVKGEASFPKRLATQYGVGTAIDQGVRAYVDSEQVPLLFSEQALAGRLPGQPKAVSKTSSFSDIVPDVGGLRFKDILEDIPSSIPGAPYLDPVKAAQDAASAEAERQDVIKDVGLTALALLFGYGAIKYRNVLKAADAPKPAFGIPPEAGPKGDFGTAVDIVQSMPTFGTKFRTAKELAKNRLLKTFGRQVDSDVLLIQAARARGVPEHIINQLHGQGGVDAAGQLEAIIKAGVMPNGDRLPVALRDLKSTFDQWDTGRQDQFLQYIASLGEDIVRTKGTADEFLGQMQVKIDAKGFDSLTKTEQKAFFAVRDARQGFEKVPVRGAPTPQNPLGEIIPGEFHDPILKDLSDLERVMVEHRATVASIRKADKRVEVGLWNKDKTEVIDDPTLRKAIEDGNLDAEFAAHKNALVKFNEMVLRDSVRRGVEGEKWVEHIIRSHTRNGESMYIPRQSAEQTVAWHKRQAMQMGLATTNGKTMNIVGNLLKQKTGRQEGINAAMGPHFTTANYTGSILEHTNRNVAQMNWMRNILDFDFDEAGNVVFNPHNLDEFGEFTEDFLRQQAARDKLFFTRPPVYIGRISAKDPLNQFDTLNLRYHNPKNKLSGEKVDDFQPLLASDDPGIVQSAMEQIGDLKDALVIKRKGDYYIFSKMDPLVKHALEFETGLMNSAAQFNNFFKRAMTIGTTGRYSTFAPFSFVYNASIGALNAALRDKGGIMSAGMEGIRVWRDGIKGATDIFVSKVAEDFAQIMAHSIAKNIGLAAKNPEMARRIQAKLQARAKRSMMQDFNLQTGGIGAGGQTGADEFLGNITDVLSKTNFKIRDGAAGNILPQLVRTWDHLNAALHEGVTFGVALRKLGGTTKGKTENQLRVAKRETADLVGNNKLQGASAMARQLTAAVPFYGAALQGITTLGRAVKQAGTVKTVAKLTAFVGTPVALEIAYNMAVDSGETYSDGKGKQWTKAQWYWHVFSDAQRNNNVIIFPPGLHPNQAILFPVIPEIAALRSFYIDALEVIFGLNEHTRYELNQIQEGTTRVGNVPLPPFVKAVLSSFGVDVRAGLAYEEDGLSIIQKRTLPLADRMTPNLERARFQGGEISARIAAIIQDLGGALATIGLKTFEAFFSGTESTPITERAVAAVDQLGISALQASRYAGSLFNTRGVSVAQNQHIASQVFAKTEALKELSKVHKLNVEGPSMLQGTTQDIQLDPVYQAAAAEAGNAQREIQQEQKEILDLKRDMKSMQHSRVNNYGGIPGISRGAVTVKQVAELTDAFKLEINKRLGVILGLLKASEERFANTIGEEIGRDLSGFTYDGLTPRANPSSASPTLPKLPQTSQ